MATLQVVPAGANPTPSSPSAVDFRSSDPAIRPILDATFPSYGEPDVTVRPFEGPMILNSYWDGGTREEYRFYSLVEKRVVPIPTSHPFFDRRRNGDRMGNIGVSELPEGWVLVRGGTWCGKTAHITIYARPADLAPALAPPAVELSKGETAALNVICTIRGGCRPEYFRQADLGTYGAQNKWILMLRCRDLVKVNRAGAVSITTEGRNVHRSCR